MAARAFPPLRFALLLLRMRLERSLLPSLTFVRLELGEGTADSFAFLTYLCRPVSQEIRVAPRLRLKRASTHALGIVIVCPMGLQKGCILASDSIELGG